MLRTPSRKLLQRSHLFHCKLRWVLQQVPRRTLPLVALLRLRQPSLWTILQERPLPVLQSQQRMLAIKL